MATVAKLLDFRFGSNGTPSTLVDRSNDVSSLDFPREQDLPETTVFNNSGARSYAVGLNGASLSVQFQWSAAIETQLANLVNYDTAVSFQVGENGSASGQIKKTGTMFLKSFKQGNKVGDIKTLDAEFQVTGAITVATY